MLELKLEKFARILLYAVPFLALIFIEGFYFPFVIAKTVYFRLLIELGLSLYVLLLALDFKKYRPRFNWALALAAIFLLIQLAAAALGLDFYKSFWSNFERMEGAVSLICLALYLFLLQAFLREKKQWLFYVRLILISSLAVSLYGLGQKFNLLPVFEAGVGRLTSTIGNAAFLAGYLLIAAGLGIYYYFNETDKKYRSFALAAVAVNSLALLLTSTRGAILGLAAGITLYLLFSAAFLPGKARKISLAALIAIAVLAGAFFVFRNYFAGSKIEFLSRLATISANDGTVANRLLVWRMALRDFKYHPILGVGLENFDVIFNKYYWPGMSENWFDRTHNVYLDQLMAGGLMGLAAYLAIFFYLFYRLWRGRGEDWQKFAVLTALLAAYGIHNFFVFDTINTSFLYFFLIGLVSFKAPDFREDAGRPIANNRAFNYVFFALIIANIFIFYKLVYLPLKINRAIYVGYYYVIADPYRSYENFKQALSYKFGSTEAAVQLAKMNEVVDGRSDVNAQIKREYLALTREKLQFAAANFPLDLQTKMYLGQLILNNYRDKAELAEAENLLKESVKLSPTRVEPYYLLYNLYGQEGKKSEARAALDDLENKLPWYGGVKVMLMSDLTKAKDDPKKAEELYKQAVSQAGFSDFGGLIKIISYLLDQKRYGETVPYYEKLFGSEPKRYDYRLDLAKVYYLTGQIDKAVEQVNIISASSPETLKGYEGFVNMLNAATKK